MPSLNTIMHAQLLNAVSAGTSKRVRYMPYPAGGTLDVAELYPCRAQHTGQGVPRRTGCVAMVTSLSVDTTAHQTVTITSGTRQVEVDPNACILFSSYIARPAEAEPCGNNKQHGHFRLYETLMFNPQFSDVRELRRGCEESVSFPDLECTWIRDYIRGTFTSVHVECGNSTYP